MSKFFTILKAVWAFIFTNREIIEKHIQYIKNEVAELKAKKAASDSSTSQQSQDED